MDVTAAEPVSAMVEAEESDKAEEAQKLQGPQEEARFSVGDGCCALSETLSSSCMSPLPSNIPYVSRKSIEMFQSNRFAVSHIFVAKQINMSDLLSILCQISWVHHTSIDKIPTPNSITSSFFSSMFVHIADMCNGFHSVCRCL